MSDTTKIKEAPMATARLSEIGTHPVTGAHILTKLELSNAGLVDTKELTKYPLVQRVVARNNCLTDLSALGELPFLAYLDATDNRIENLHSLPICELHETNTEQGKPETNSQPKRAGQGMLPISQLREMVLARNRISSVSDMSWHKLLTRLDLSGNLLVNMGVIIGALPNLRELILAFNRITKLGTYEDLASSALESINLDDNGVEDISPLSALRNLKSLSVRRNAISTLQGFESELLCELWLADNAIQSAVDLAPLDRCVSLLRLELCGNPLSVAALNDARAEGDSQESLTPVDEGSSKFNDSGAGNVESFYRQRVVHRLPSLVELDNVNVNVDDRVNAANFHGADLASRKLSVAAKSPGLRFHDYLQPNDNMPTGIAAGSTRSLLAVQPTSLDSKASSVLGVAMSLVDRVLEHVVEDYRYFGTQAV